MEAKHKRRLLKLADFLDKLPRKQFDYGNWVSPGSELPKEGSCGTSACAIGWACSMAPFRRLGASLKLDFDGYWWPHLRDVEDSTEYDVGRTLFGLKDDEFNHLFIPSSVYGLPFNATPKQVAKHIRKFVESKC